ncbi:DNA mismatch repair protein MutS [Candidatus Parcubacteria bacterium]|nr:DNA mismatch repair protein MutS [Candidatus Parcubacteria bacterium]
MRQFSTPMMRQYAAIKQEYADCLLFFRLGDFYELFLEDALIGAKVLDIVLTRRPRGKDGDVPMAGVPFHAADAYIAKLVKAGHKVAICEQTSEPNGRSLVEREVVRIVTPGTILDEKSLSSKEHNYTMSLAIAENIIGIAVADISTGDFETQEYEYTDNLAHIIANEYARFRPAECIVNFAVYNNPTLLKLLKLERNINIYCFETWDESAEQAERLLKRHFEVKSLRGFGLHDKEHALRASGALLAYLANTQKNNIGHIKKITSVASDNHVGLDASTIANLELFETIREGEEQGAFIGSIDSTKTAMGGRMLRTWIREPLRNKKEIEMRFQAVEGLLHERSIRNKTRAELQTLYDIERIISRLSVGIGNPHDLINLKNTLFAIQKTHTLLSAISTSSIQELIREIPDAKHIAEQIDTYIIQFPALDPKNGDIINEGVDKELDTLRENIRDSKQWIANLETLERKRTGIGSLKVKFNSVFGYYIEITKSNLDSVPADYIRKQTTVNAERFITHKLQEYEDTVLRGQELINKREYELFIDLIKKVLAETHMLQKISENIATLDCLLSFADTAERERYTKPIITSDGELTIEDGRHPVVEQLHESSFVPNNTHLNQTDHQLLIITGPNMAGKSVYMRQVALIVLMAHMGSFVPARRASISLVDKIFVRSGAADNIGRGLSTFMVEMVETAYILNHATRDSLIIMDEIGRGTSTYDGISIAWAIAEYLVTHPDHAAKTLFATHYHELQQLEKVHPKRIKNFHMAIEESNNAPIFLYRLIRGGALGSYAIAVAKLAGVPQEVTNRAAALLLTFTEKKEK